MFERITVDSIGRRSGGLNPKTSTCVDSVSNKMVTFVIKAISEALSIIINQMLKLDNFPNSLKYLLWPQKIRTLYLLLHSFENQYKTT